LRRRISDAVGYQSHRESARRDLLLATCRCDPAGGSWTCFEEAALLTTAANLRTPNLPTSHRRDDVAGGTDTLAIAD
jgi:hypothetical protein